MQHHMFFSECGIENCVKCITIEGFCAHAFQDTNNSLSMLCNKKHVKRYFNISNNNESYGSGDYTSGDGEYIADFRNLNTKEQNQESGNEISGEGDYESGTIFRIA